MWWAFDLRWPEEDAWAELRELCKLVEDELDVVDEGMLTGVGLVVVVVVVVVLGGDRYVFRYVFR